MKKTTFYLLGLIIITSCSDNMITIENVVQEEKLEEIITPIQINSQEIQDIIDSSMLKGSILILKDNKFYSNNFVWAKTGYLPASTFKIPNSIFALELEIIENDSTLLPWDGEPRYQKRWEQDLTFKQAFHYSCVPCYQDIARKIGSKKMKHLIKKLDYGHIIFDTSEIDRFWLQGNSKINQFEQIEFLKAFQEEKLPITKRTYTIMKRMMIIKSDTTTTLRGKTGWSVTNEIDNCWFIGYTESEEGMTYFATNIEPKSGTKINDLVDKRKDVTLKALELIK